MKSAALILSLFLSCLLSIADESPKFESKPGQSILLLDNYTVAQTKNLTQQFFPAQKHASNPIMRRTERWEGVGPYLFGSRLMQDEITRELRMWYIAYDFKGNFYRWGYANSRDGLRWIKPDLNLEKI